MQEQWLRLIRGGVRIDHVEFRTENKGVMRIPFSQFDPRQVKCLIESFPTISHLSENPAGFGLISGGHSFYLMNNNVLYHALSVTCYPYVKFEGVANYNFCLLVKVGVAKVKGCGRCLQNFWVASCRGARRLSEEDRR